MKSFYDVEKFFWKSFEALWSSSEIILVDYYCTKPIIYSSWPKLLFVLQPYMKQ